MQILDRIRSTLAQLKSEGVTLSELIECIGNEYHALLLEDASADELDTRSADSSQTTA